MNVNLRPAWPQVAEFLFFWLVGLIAVRLMVDAYPTAGRRWLAAVWPWVGLALIPMGMRDLRRVSVSAAGIATQAAVGFPMTVVPWSAVGAVTLGASRSWAFSTCRKLNVEGEPGVTLDLCREADFTAVAQAITHHLPQGAPRRWTAEQLALGYPFRDVPWAEVPSYERFLKEGP